MSHDKMPTIPNTEFSAGTLAEQTLAEGKDRRREEKTVRRLSAYSQPSLAHTCPGPGEIL